MLETRDGHTLSGAQIVITGGAGFRAVIRTDRKGAFVLVLPYDQYLFSAGDRQDASSSGVTVFIAPLQTTRLELILDSSGALSRRKVAARFRPGLWADATRAQVYPEAFSLQGVLLSREPSSVSQPLDFDGLSDNRLMLESQRGFSWTDTQYRLQGIEVTDSYQPGRPAVAPDMQALDEVVVRDAFAQTASSSHGTEVGLFLAQGRKSWHGALSSADTGSLLASTNLPPPSQRGIVQQDDKFLWFTRDNLHFGGPVTKWADLFVSATGQWSSQTVPLALAGTDQHSRMLFGNASGRIRAGPQDQFDILYSGTRMNLSGWGMPVGLEALATQRIAPSFVLPGGFPGESETDHFDFIQAGWTHQLARVSGLGALQVRYGHSSAHLDSEPSVLAGEPAQSRIELLGGFISGEAPLGDLAIRTRQDLEGTYQPDALRIAGTRHQFTAGMGWKTSSPSNRFTAPSDMNLITASGAAAFVTELNTPLDSRACVRTFTGFVADHISLTRGLSLDLGGLADFSRGSLPSQSSPSGNFAQARTFAAQPDPIVWNSLSPRAGFAWQIPRSHGLVLRGTYFRLYAPLAGRYLDFGNPNSLGGEEYQWIDRNSDGWFQPGEQGALRSRFGGPYSSIAPSLARPYSDEFDVGAEIALTGRSLAGIHVFRRDDKDRLAAINIGVPAQAFTPVSILDPGPDGIPGTFDDQRLTVYQQNPATFGKDQYVLTNPPGLRMLNTGLLAEARTEWRALALNASFVAEKSYGPTNPGDAVFENDPGVAGALFLDPNTAINASGRSFVDRAYVGKIQASYRLPQARGGIELASVADYTDGLVFARQLLVTGLDQGPFVAATTVRGSPEGGNRAQYAINWNLRLSREFRTGIGRFTILADILNVTNAGQRIQENDLSGPSFNQRLPVAIEPPRIVRLQFLWQF